jgi:hypothetical protein
MKELLYIPNGEYIKFDYLYLYRRNEPNNLQKCLNYWGEMSNPEKVIKNILWNWYSSDFYERNNLPDTIYLTREQFEIVEVEK